MRVALGARGADVVRLLVREGAVFAVGGVAIGLIVASASTRAVASWLYGVGATDPTTFAAVAVAVIAVALAASWVRLTAPRAPTQWKRCGTTEPAVRFVEQLRDRDRQPKRIETMKEPPSTFAAE